MLKDIFQYHEKPPDALQGCFLGAGNSQLNDKCMVKKKNCWD